MTLSICIYAGCHNAMCRIFLVLCSVIMLSVVAPYQQPSCDIVKKYTTTGPQYYQNIFIYNLRMFIISTSDSSWHSFLA
jgi:hypothetical protein